MVWLVSHLKTTWPPNANLTRPPQWCVLLEPPRRKSATPWGLTMLNALRDLLGDDRCRHAQGS